MARINSNIPSLIAQANLQRANADLNVRLERLATGVRINRGADDPAGLIVSERLRSEVSGLDQAVKNSERASSVIATAEAAMSEIANLLTSVQGLIVEAANTGGISDEERKANQLQIDSAIESITRIANATGFGGLKLLNGELDYILSGLATSAITKARVFGANFNGQPDVEVNVEVVNSAQTAQLYLSTSTGGIVSTTKIEIAGPLGVQVIEILSGTPTSNIVAAVNNVAAATGVTAAMLSAGDETSGMVFATDSYGSSEFVSVRRIGGPPNGGAFETYKLPDDTVLPGSFSFTNAPLVALLETANRDIGRDVAALINGNLGDGDGLTISVDKQSTLSVEMLLTADLATRVGNTTSFRIIGGGATFQIGGEINPNQQVNLGIQSMTSERLGATLLEGEVFFLGSLKTGGENALKTRRFEQASRVIQSSIDEVSTLRGRIGAFERNTLDTNIRSLGVAVENLTASESRIRDADFAKETSELSRTQILSQASTNVLALANQQAQQVLALLG